MNLEQYFKNFEAEVKKIYGVAEEAKKTGLDPTSSVEIPLARSMAEKVVALISTLYPQMTDAGIEKRILELEDKWGKLNVAVSFKIAEEVAKQKFCKFSSLLEAIDAGIRLGFAYITLGVVSSPIEGYTKLKLGKTHDGKEYFVAYFSGPIRSAGTTASCVALMLIDYLRELFGYAKYDPTPDEIKRYYLESLDYHERITNLQYMTTEEEALFLAKSLPIQIAGDKTEKREVSNYKNLERIDTSFIRGGMALMFSECLGQKAKKGLRLLKTVKEKGFKSTGWDYLEDYVKLQEQREKGKKEEVPTYIKELVAGRPVLGHPSRSGAFRFRYGRGRTSGFSATSIHPASMAITDGFLAIGTQLKIEKPTKGTVITTCDSIDGPIVKLYNGSVKKLETAEEAKEIYPDVEEIIYLGDILFPLSDIINRNADLVKPGYVEEWWGLELAEKDQELGAEVDRFDISFEKAADISRKHKIPLHPKFIFYWTQISKEELLGLVKWLKHARINEKIIFSYIKTEREKFALGKRALELLGVEHEVTIENVVLSKENSKALFANLGLDLSLLEKGREPPRDFIDVKEFYIDKPILEIVNSVSEFEIKDKAGEFVGARMGRPEKAKLRKLTGSPNVLFPVGREGGRLRSVQEACEVGRVWGSFPIRYCKTCKKETIYSLCEECENKTEQRYYCPVCKDRSFERCKEHERSFLYATQKIDIKDYLQKAKDKIKISDEDMPLLIKGVRGLSSASKQTEHLAKGILRAKYNLQVNKDGTVRFDATELPLISFRPREISVSIEKLRQLGYTQDMYGEELVDENQILELMPHDILLPSCSESHDERADDVFVKVANFVDSLLVDFYGLKPFYNVKKREDLVGHLGVCMSPHNCAGVICRFIGFSNTLGLMASPYMHAAIRRDCVFPTTKIFFYNADTKEVFYDNIGDYVEKLIKEGAEIKKIDSFGTFAVENKLGIYALGIDPLTHEIKKKKIKYFVKGPKTKEWVKITTATNREYIMTPTHKFMFIEDGKFKFKGAKNVEVNDKLPVLEKFELETGIREINLIELFQHRLSEEEKKQVFVNDGKREWKLIDFYSKKELKNIDCRKLTLRHSFSKHKILAIIPIDKNLMRFLGYYTAEGYSRINKWVAQVSFRVCNREMQDHLVEIIKKIFGIKASLGEENSKITICSKLIYYFLKSLRVGKGAYDKRVPRFIFGSDKKLLTEYISAYFEGDGSIIKNKNIVFYSVSRDLLDDIALLLTRLGIIGRYFRTTPRIPGKRVLERYKELRKKPQRHILNHLVLGVYDSFKLSKILKVINKEKAEKINFLQPFEKRYLRYNGKQILMKTQSDYVEDCVKKIEIIEDPKNSYCVEIDWKNKEDRNILWGEQIINTRCDGDEAATMLLGDVLLNFSKVFLPAHRGGTQDSPLVLNAKIDAGEVDEQILDLEFAKGDYPLELYGFAEQKKHSSEINVENVASRLKENKNPFSGIGFTHNTKDINEGVVCSTYKTLPTMQEKVQHQMQLVEKIRAADTSDTARLIIEKHFIKDMRGNLREFSMQNFRCVACNKIMRRPPLSGVCSRCSGKIIFTVHEGGVRKYLDAAIDLAEKYHLSPYLKQHLELTKRYIDSVFGREPEKQEKLAAWF